MNCYGYHNFRAVKLSKEIPDLKSGFTWGTYQLAPFYKVNGGIFGQIIADHNTMPPGIGATREEREALWKCLEDENDLLSEQARKDIFENYSCGGLTAVRVTAILPKDASGGGHIIT